MPLKPIVLALAATAAAALSPLSRADVLWDNGPVLRTGNEFVNFNCAGPACGAGWTLYDDFTLGEDATVTGLVFASQFMRADYGPGDPPLSGYRGSRWSIWSVDPATGFDAGPLVSGTALGTLDAAGQPQIYTVSLAGLNLELKAGHYWLGLQNTLDETLVSTYVPSDDWPVRDGALQLDDAGGSGVAWTPAASFSVHGTVTAVPEPETWALLGVGLAAAGWARRRTRAGA